MPVCNLLWISGKKNLVDLSTYSSIAMELTKEGKN